jgi:orotate phosphoribosyltransferase
MKERLVQILKERSVRRERFKLASGKESDFYVDARQTTLHPEGAFLIASMILERLRPEVKAVGGPVTGADPIAGAVALLSFTKGRTVQGFMVRKRSRIMAPDNGSKAAVG